MTTPGTGRIQIDRLDREDRAFLAIGLAVSLALHAAVLGGVAWLWRFRLPDTTMTVSVALVPAPAAPAGVGAEAPRSEAATPAAPLSAGLPAAASTAAVAASRARSRPSVPRRQARAAPARPAPAAPLPVPSMPPAGPDAITDEPGGASGPRGNVGGSASHAVPGAGDAGDLPATFQGFDNKPPRYPPVARRRNEQGRVVLQVTVGADGAVEALSVLVSSGSRLLDDAAMDAVRRWRFNPARRAGIAIVARVEVPILFRLTM